MLDWELSTLGDPFTDLAACCLAYYLPSDYPLHTGNYSYIYYLFIMICKDISARLGVVYLG